ncbi:hypothetical protein LguiA_011512 [Lonicera macranthoides]
MESCLYLLVKLIHGVAYTPLDPEGCPENESLVNKKAASVIAHYSSIMASLVCLWDFSSGSLLDTCEIGAEDLESTEEKRRAITPSLIHALPWFNGSLHCIGQDFIPTCLGTTLSSELLWMVMGVSNLHGSDCASLDRVRLSLVLTKTDLNWVRMVLADTEITEGEKLLRSLLIEKEVFSAAAEAVKTGLNNLVIEKALLCKKEKGNQEEKQK